MASGHLDHCLPALVMWCAEFPQSAAGTRAATVATGCRHAPHRGSHQAPAVAGASPAGRPSRAYCLVRAAAVRSAPTVSPSWTRTDRPGGRGLPQTHRERGMTETGQAGDTRTTGTAPARARSPAAAAVVWGTA